MFNTHLSFKNAPLYVAGIDPNLAFKKSDSEKYFAFTSYVTKALISFTRRQPCLANITILKSHSFLNPRPPPSLASHIRSHTNHLIHFPVLPCFHQKEFNFFSISSQTSNRIKKRFFQKFGMIWASILSRVTFPDLDKIVFYHP